MDKRGINLLREQLLPETSWDKVYGWILGTARVIILSVELIVIFAFVTRVVVDTKSGQIDKNISNTITELTAYQGREFIFREVRKKTNKYRDLWEASSNISLYMGYIDNILKNMAGEISVGIKNNTITIRGVLPIDNINYIEDTLKNTSSNPLPTGQIKLRAVELAEINTKNTTQPNVGEFLIRAQIIPTKNKRIL